MITRLWPRRSSIRSKLYTIIIICLVPSLIMLTASIIRLTGYSHELAETEITRVTDGIALQQKLLIQSTAQMLRAVASSGEIQGGSVPDMQRFLTRLLRDNFQYDVILAADTEGTILASSQPGDTFNLADRPYFQEALTSIGIVVGPYTLSRATGTPVIPIVLPVRDSKRNLVCILLAGLKVTSIMATFSSTSLFDSSVLELVDREGNRILRLPPKIDCLNGKKADPELLQAFPEDGDDLTTWGTYAGVGSLYRRATVSLGPSRHPAFRVLMVMSGRYTAYNQRLEFLFCLVSGLLFLGLSILLAGRLYRTAVGRRLELMMEEVESLGSGEQTDRIIVGNNEDELDLLMQNLRHAMRALKKREEERTATAAAMATSLCEKETLLKEVHHRVKNNFQVISSLLSLQGMEIEDGETLKAFAVASNRIQSMALIHEHLYNSGTFSSIEFGEYARELIGQMRASHQPGLTAVTISLLAGSATLPLESAVPAGLILNELVSNCFKHAFPGGRSGRILIELTAEGERRARISVSDNGVGFPRAEGNRKKATLGLELIKSLSQQLRGTYEVESPDQRTGFGTRFFVIFPLEGGCRWEASSQEVPEGTPDSLSPEGSLYCTPEVPRER